MNHIINFYKNDKNNSLFISTRDIYSLRNYKNNKILYSYDINTERPKITKKRNYKFNELYYHSIIDHFQVSLLSWDGFINKTINELKYKDNYDWYMKNWYFIFEKISYNKINLAFTFFRSLDFNKNKTKYEKYHKIIKSKLCEFMIYWRDNRSRNKCNIFLLRIYAYFSRIYYFNNIEKITNKKIIKRKKKNIN